MTRNARPSSPPRCSPSRATSPPPRAAPVASDGEYEAKLVDEVTAPGGVRAAISREELRKFLSAVKSLDSRSVAALLQQRMEGSEWQRRLKALMVIEGLLKEGDDSVLGHFQKNVACIQAQLSSTQASLKEKARKLLELLGIDHHAPRTSGAGTAPAGHAAPPSAPAAPAAPVENLLDLGAESPPPPAAAEGSSLFDGLSLGAEPPAVGPAAAAPATCRSAL